MSKSIDDLIVQVNRVALQPDSEVLREPCILNVVEVYKKVDYEDLAVVEGIFFVKKGIVELPVTCLKVQDVRQRIHGRDKEDTEAYQIGMIGSTSRDRIVTPLSFRIEGSKIKFVNKELDYVKVIYDSLPTDDRGEIIIEEFMFMACLHYCRFQEMLVKSSNTKQERSTLNPTMIHSQLADRAIDEARGFKNAGTAPDDRYVEMVHKIGTHVYP